MMPRRISVVPPWMVSLGATLNAKASCSSSVTRLPTSGSRKAVRSRTRSGSFCSHERSEVLDDRSLHHRLLAGLQHAGDRHRHAPQCVQLRHQPPKSFCAAQIGIGAERAHHFGQHEISFEEPLGPAALIGKLAGRLFPGAIDLSKRVVVGDESIIEHDLVEIVLADHVNDRIDRDARRFHVDQKLCQPVAAVFIGRRRGAEQAEHIVGDMGVAGPDLGAVDLPAAVDLGRSGLGGEQIGAGAGLAHADDEAQFAAADAWKYILFDVLRCVLEQDRTALPVGDEVQPHRRVGDAEFFRHHVALEEAAFVATVFLRPGHADPAFGADFSAEGAVL